MLCWPGDNLMIHAAVEQARPGDIIVDHHDVALHATARSASCSPRRCAARGVRGLIMGAGLRDTRELREMGFPAWTAHVSAQGTVKETPGAVNVPVTIGGQMIRPGDAIVADDDGVCVVPRLDVAAAVTASAARVAKEDANREELADGAARPRHVQPAPQAGQGRVHHLRRVRQAGRRGRLAGAP